MAAESGPSDTFGARPPRFERRIEPPQSQANRSDPRHVSLPESERGKGTEQMPYHDVLVAMERGGRRVDHPVEHHLGIELPASIRSRVERGFIGPSGDGAC